jgi:hypothetical protein
VVSDITAWAELCFPKVERSLTNHVLALELQLQYTAQEKQCNWCGLITGNEASSSNTPSSLQTSASQPLLLPQGLPFIIHYHLLLIFI